MSKARQALGARGERLAEAWLVKAGWRIIGRRFRSGHRDIDLVAERGEEGDRTIAFIEVKTRLSPAYGGPLGAVHWRKQREMARAARDWISKFRRPGEQYRFDVIGVTQKKEMEPEIIHLENAFSVR